MRFALALAFGLLFQPGCTPDPDTGETGLDLPTSGSFQALTYNVEGLPPEITGDDTTAQQALIAPLLGGYELVALQEDFIESNHEVLAAGCPHRSQHWFDEPLDGHPYGSGLALFGDYQELVYQEQHYSECYGTLDNASDCLASKGFQVMRLRLGAGSLDVYNTHHEAGGGDEDTAVRESQVDEVLEAMSELSAGKAVLFLGDFNLHGDDPEDLPALEAYWDFGLEDACDLVGCSDPGRIDRALIRSGDLTLTPTSWEVPDHFVDEHGAPLSDHEPILFGFDWTVAGS